jgi:hypothetical protein
VNFNHFFIQPAQVAKHHGYWAPNSTRGFIDCWLSWTSLWIYQYGSFRTTRVWLSVRLRYFVKRNSMLLLYCCDHHYDLCFIISSLPFFKLHGTCCHFSFINNPSEKRNCVYVPNSEALLSKLDGVKSPCIINVKTSAVFKVGISQCITVIVLFYSQISALLFYSCTVIL